MKEAIIHPGTKVEIIDSPIPSAGEGQVVLKVIFSGSNPKDWKGPEWFQSHINQGDDVAGVVYQVGHGVTEFHVGDRVAALHELRTPHGSYAEYSLCWAYSTFHIPDHVSFEEAATIPLAAMTAAVGLYARLRLPEPWHALPDSQRMPLLIYGASSAVGSYAVQLARQSNIHPIICVAGRATKHVEQFIDRKKGDTIVDYRNGDIETVSGIRDALAGAQLADTFDCVSEEATTRNICQVLSKEGGQLTTVLPDDLSHIVPSSVQLSFSGVAEVHHGLATFGYIHFRYLAKALEKGWVKPHPYEVTPGGLDGLEKGLWRLRNGEASAINIAEEASGEMTEQVLP